MMSDDSDIQRVVCETILKLDKSSLGIPHSHAYWVNGDDVGYNYCFDCVEIELKKAQTEQPNVEFFKDGGFMHEDDSTAGCERCGMMLDISLTDHAVSEELEFFSENPPAEFSKQTAFELSRLLSNMVCEHPEIAKVISCANSFLNLRPEGDNE